MADLVLEDGHSSASRDNDLFELLVERRLAAVEVVIEVGEDGVKRDLTVARPIPVIHVRFEPLPGPISVEAKSLVQPCEPEGAHSNRIGTSIGTCRV